MGTKDPDPELLKGTAPDGLWIEGLEEAAEDELLRAAAEVPTDPGDIDAIAETLLELPTNVRLEIDPRPLRERDDNWADVLQERFGISPEAIEELLAVEESVLGMLAEPDQLVAFALDPLNALDSAGIEVGPALRDAIKQSQAEAAEKEIPGRVAWTQALEIVAVEAEKLEPLEDQPTDKKG